ncbi:hypothetical protein GCM10007881_26990 [Mesorhizobium huakuii]|uniref:hypothetical protein n=1 Tax=Mesorhizobium huakuii TaxID=28104 RepID=UPI00235B7DBA|nr:hypothetical protein [Mesorhizobium huakuii]GLQ79181.1 hypothetical protein GCM10007881_26990 [Mesorhizobium huakuii]
MNVTKGLIIDDPWIGYILDGSKTWEMRSRTWGHRGWIGLIRKGTGAVWAVARLVDVGAPLSEEEMIASFDKHRIPPDMIRSGAVAKWTTPWKLADVRKLSSPVPYRHKSGAVTQVDLDAETSDGIARQLADRSVDIGKPQPASTAAAGNWVSKSNAPVQPAPAPKKVFPANVAPPKFHNGGGRLIGECEVTDGALKNSYIRLTKLMDKFPRDAIGGSNDSTTARRELIVDWGGPELVRTDLDGQKKFFRRRGWVGDFYKLNRAKAGDKVRIEEAAAYRYCISLVR